MKKFVIIAAGGSGVRMNTDKLKQFIVLAGKPILMHTIDVFYKYDNDINIILALPPDQIEYWKELCTQYEFNIKHTIAEGGVTRFNSVKNALKLTDNDSLVAIHDAVRPLVSISTIDSCFDTARLLGNAIPVIDIVESTRYAEVNNNRLIDRAKIKIVQTPQVFSGKLIKSAYQSSQCTDYTDDASVIEALRYKINLVAGDRENIKITTPIDLIFAEALFNNLKTQL